MVSVAPFQVQLEEPFWGDGSVPENDQSGAATFGG
jgi:hypothetical protein